MNEGIDFQGQGWSVGTQSNKAKNCWAARLQMSRRNRVGLRARSPAYDNVRTWFARAAPEETTSGNKQLSMLLWLLHNPVAVDTENARPNSNGKL